MSTVRAIVGQKATPMDFLLWPYLKSKIFNSNPVSLEELKERIHEEIQIISQNT